MATLPVNSLIWIAGGRWVPWHPSPPLGEPLHRDVEGRHQEDAEDGDREHPADHGRADRVPAGGARSGRDDQRERAQNERRGRHEERSEAKPGGLTRGLPHVDPTLATL